jgi:hypothetical protein
MVRRQHIDDVDMGRRVDMSSLLAHLHTKIRGAAEDVATLSLQYILEYSDAARRSFLSYVTGELNIASLPEIQFRTQVAGKNQERPDLAGYDEENNELILIESKFWAGLTDNQPLGYIERLRDSDLNADKALLFICPKARMISLWSELLRICGLDYTRINKAESYASEVQGIHMGMLSWSGILGVLELALSAEQSPLVADLKQLQGLCDLMDAQAFKPFEREDFGVDRARRIVDYYSIVDRLTDLLKSKMGASTKNLKASPQYAGYIRYLTYEEFGLSIIFSCHHWLDYAETPFWLTIKETREKTWVYAREAHRLLKGSEALLHKRIYFEAKSERVLVPLYAPADKVEDDVINDLYKQIADVVSIIKP